MAWSVKTILEDYIGDKTEINAEYYCEHKIVFQRSRYFEILFSLEIKTFTRS